MKPLIVLAAAAFAALAQAQSARKQPEPGYIPAPPAISQDKYSYSPNTFQGPGQPGYGATLPAGTRPGSAHTANGNAQAQPTTNEGQLYRANLNDNNVYPYLRTTPSIIGPQAPHKLPRAVVEPLPPDYTTPTPPPSGGTNVQRGAPQGANPATNANPQGLSPEKHPSPSGRMLQVPP